jgi:N-acetyl-gamma-glutamyl-phosphate reductase
MKISIVGATAYTSRELLQILARHPEAEVVHLGGRREGQPRVSEVFTSLRGVCDLPVIGLHVEDAPQKPDVAFFTLPHGLSQQFVPEYLDAGVRCVDFSADYRLPDLALYEAWYCKHEDPGNVARAVYGLPELFREQVAGADLVANPGCYPTGFAIALAPLVKAGLVDCTDVVVATAPTWSSMPTAASAEAATSPPSAPCSASATRTCGPITWAATGTSRRWSTS